MKAVTGVLHIQSPYVKIAQIQSFCGLHFPVFELNTQT